MDETFSKSLNFILSEVFGKDINISLVDIESNLTQDLALPTRAACAFTNNELWTTETGEKFISLDALKKHIAQDEFMLPPVPLSSAAEVLSAWKRVDYILGSKSIDSLNTSKSDNIYGSSFIYNSGHIFHSKWIFLSQDITKSSYMIACKNSESSQLCIRSSSSNTCSNSFEISYSYKVRNSFFIHDSTNLSDCMFCSHLQSKRFCIANMQFNQEEYFTIKKRVVEHLVRQKLKAF